jgi:hypothetical protein
MFNSSSSSLKRRLEIIQSEQVEKFNLDVAEKKRSLREKSKMFTNAISFFVNLSIFCREGYVRLTQWLAEYDEVHMVHSSNPNHSLLRTERETSPSPDFDKISNVHISIRRCLTKIKIIIVQDSFFEVKVSVL